MKKRCSKPTCRKQKLLSEFYSNSKSSDGLASWCKECQKAYIRRFQLENKEQTAENKRNYVRSKPEIVKASKDKYREQNRDILKEKNRIYQRKNNKRILAKTRLYQAKKWSNYQTLDPSEKKLIQQFYLNCPKGWHVDHIVPLSRDGKHCLSNLQYLSARANLQKSNKI